MVNNLGLRTVAIIGVLLILLTACSGESRPTIEEWQPTWERVVDGFPSAEQLGEPPDREVCSHALGVLRSEAAGLTPTPDLAIDDVVTDWLKIAENTVYECPPSNQTIPNLEYAYNELARLEAEVAVVLAIDTANG
ncbi:MAG: hypothetical protein M3096_03170 [Actinomycetia bacterium]|nr:hypothetical protein [Actinomycetes bacterium]